MTALSGEFRESSAQPRVEKVGLSHASVEVGHLYMKDLQGGPAALRATFREIAPWVQTATKLPVSTRRPGSTRVSTCFLVDDYFNPVSPPTQVLPAVLEAAEEAGVRIDYLARESACADAGSTGPAELVLSRFVPEPPRGTTGDRPRASESGWLCNGERSPNQSASEAMRARQWQAPVQTSAQRHSIFVDVELWSGEAPRRLWSCPMLAATWQLLRLGLLRDYGRPIVTPQALPPKMPSPQAWASLPPDTPFLPQRWADLPPVTQLNPDAQPFSAYTTISIVSPRFLPVELAVRTILSQLNLEAAVLDNVAERAGREGMELSVEVVDRLHYVFVGSSRTDPP